MLPAKQKKAYASFYNATANNAVLDQKTTIMIQLADSMSIGCYPWMEHFSGVAGDQGITEKEIGTVLSIVMAVSAGRVRAQFRDTGRKGKQRKQSRAKQKPTGR